jgi:hypothetical protein
VNDFHLGNELLLIDSSQWRRKPVAHELEERSERSPVDERPVHGGIRRRLAVDRGCAHCQQVVVRKALVRGGRAKGEMFDQVSEAVTFRRIAGRARTHRPRDADDGQRRISFEDDFETARQSHVSRRPCHDGRPDVGTCGVRPGACGERHTYQPREEPFRSSTQSDHWTMAPSSTTHVSRLTILLDCRKHKRRALSPIHGFCRFRLCSRADRETLPSHRRQRDDRQK